MGRRLWPARPDAATGFALTPAPIGPIAAPFDDVDPPPDATTATIPADAERAPRLTPPDSVRLRQGFTIRDHA